MRSILDSRKWILALLLFLFPLVMTGDETRIKYVPSPECFVIVKGTSSLHEWSVQGDHIDGYAEFKKPVTGLSLGDVLMLSSDSEKPVVHVSISTASLKSDKKAMDKKMYDVLKSDQYPYITYDLSAIAVAEVKDQLHLMIKTTGLLNVAGVARPLEMSVMVEGTGQNKIVFTGKTRLKMTNFQIKPPKAMLGMLKTGDEVEVEFKWGISPPSKTEGSR